MSSHLSFVTRLEVCADRLGVRKCEHCQRCTVSDFGRRWLSPAWLSNVWLGTFPCCAKTVVLQMQYFRCMLLSSSACSLACSGFALAICMSAQAGGNLGMADHLWSSGMKCACIVLCNAAMPVATIESACQRA